MKCEKFLLGTALLLLAGVSSADGQLLLERLRIDHAAMVSAERDFHDRRRIGHLEGQEAADYAAYIARLHRRVAENCVAVAKAGMPLPPDLDCPSLPMPVLAPAAIDQATEQTASEQIAVLDAQLLRGLGDFDEMLLREQERVRAAAPMTGDAGGAGAGGEGGTSGGSGGAEGADTGEAAEVAEGPAGAGDESGAAPVRGGDGGTGQGAGSGSGAQRKPGRQGTPPGIPDGSDDDVVARQLREAAEKESDPELKRRLWEEYRKYKEGTR